MKKSITLKYQESINYVVIAIRCTYKLHRLCHILNSQFSFSFERKPDYTLDLKTGVFQFPLASSQYPNSESWVYLLKNQIETSFLLPEVKHTDYIVLVKGNSCEEDANNLHAQLRTLDSIEASFLLDASNLKNVYNLLFDDEHYK